MVTRCGRDYVKRGWETRASEARCDVVTEEEWAREREGTKKSDHGGDFGDVMMVKKQMKDELVCAEIMALRV